MAARARRPCPLPAARAACVGAQRGVLPPEGARAYLEELPDARFHLLDTGRFVTATDGAEIADLITAFLSRVVASAAA